MDPIANMFSQIKNAASASQKETVVPYSKLKLAILELLKAKGYLENFEEVKEEDKKFPTGIKVIIKYKNKGNVEPVLKDIKRISRPGRRVYFGSKELSNKLRGEAVLLVSTSTGIMSGHDARKKGLGGEIICEVR